jgi:hypothetical protein
MVMKTRKTTATVARQATNVPNSASAEKIVNPAFEQSLVQLRQEGSTVLNVPVSTAATLTIAGKALQGQLEVCSKQPAHSTYAGYTSLQGKQRLEYRPGNAVLGDLGVLQDLATTVRLLSCTAVQSYSIAQHQSDVPWK